MIIEQYFKSYRGFCEGTFVILHGSMGMRKFFSKGVPRLLTHDQKQQRIVDSKRYMKLFQRGQKDFMRRYLTMDESWIRHYTPETKRSSAEWTAAGKSRPERPKTQQWAGKVMASVFWDAHGILFINYLEKGKTINSDHYMHYWIDWAQKWKSTASHAKVKSAVPPRQCIVPQVHEDDGRIEWIKLRIASSPIIFFRSGP